MADTSAGRAFGFRPLYIQVKESLVRRLIDGSWQPGQLIPSEMELAREIGVSQGTIRKALNTMTAENLLVRRQGHGTYVAAPEESRILFQFFRLVPDTGDRSFPSSKVISWSKERATKEEAHELEISPTASVWRIERLRYLDEDPLIVEYITLPAKRFPGFERLSEIPNNVYRLYSERWGLTIGSGTERVKAIAASAEDARHLGCKQGTPLLRINRIAYDLERKPVELRISRCLTERAHYISDLK